MAFRLMPPITEEVGMEGSPFITRKETQMAPAAAPATVNNGLPTKQNIQRSWSMSSGEYELQKATNPRHKEPNTRSKWIIPDTDSEDDFNSKPLPFNSKDNITDYVKPAGFSKFNLPSDSDEEENPYASAKSPTCSVKSMEPPAPPPVSTMPKRSQMNTKPKGKSSSYKTKWYIERLWSLQYMYQYACRLGLLCCR